MSQDMICVIGECMVELRRESEATLACGFGGDTLNTAVYLARTVDPEQYRIAYVTALGNDSLSDQMCLSWENEGIDTSLVQRLPDKLPGLYLIETDAHGERRFHYWRNDSAARHWLHGLEADTVKTAMLNASWLYLSGITLAILNEDDRNTLMDLLVACRTRGGKIVFDNNYRSRLWPDAATATRYYLRAMSIADIALLTLEDEIALYGGGTDRDDCHAAIVRASEAGVTEIVVKRGGDSCVVSFGQMQFEIPPLCVEKVIDTTAAGDSFGAAYLAKRLSGGSVVEAAQAGHALAAKVIQHPGAIIPR